MNKKQALKHLKREIEEATEKHGIRGVFLFTDEQEVEGLVNGRGELLFNLLTNSFIKNKDLRMITSFSLMELIDSENEEKRNKQEEE